MSKRKVRTRFDRRRVSVVNNGEPTLTEQHHARACDINSIMANYIATGTVDHISKYSPQYGDATGADFQNAQILVAEQKSIFEELPAYVRKHYSHDPALWLDAMQTDEGVSEMKSLLAPGQGYNIDGSRLKTDENPSEGQSDPSPEPENAQNAQKAT